MKILAWLTGILGVVALYLAFIVAPEEAVMGPPQRIFYFHVASAWTAYLGFLVVFVASIAYLRTGARKWDRLAFSSAELGVFFTSMALLSGMTWGRAAWGIWWDWEPRLTSTFILWLVYIGYLFTQMTAEGDEKRARIAAGLGIIGFLDVPIIHMSVRWWRSLHPEVVRPGKMQMEPMMGVALLFAVVTFTLFYVYMLKWRVRTEDLRDRLFHLKEIMRQRGAAASRRG